MNFDNWHTWDQAEKVNRGSTVCGWKFAVSRRKGSLLSELAGWTGQFVNRERCFEDLFLQSTNLGIRERGGLPW